MTNEIKMIRLSYTNGHYVACMWVMADAIDSYVKAYGHDKKVIMKETSSPLYTDENGNGDVGVWTNDGYKVIRVK